VPKPVTGVGRGGKAQPVEVQRAKGNTAKKKKTAPPVPATALAVVPLSTPDAPVWCDEYGSAVWSSIWAAGRRHLSEQHDTILVSLLVERLQDRRVIRGWLGDHPENRWYVTANGQVVTHPAVKQIDQIDAQVTGWLSMLGFSPSDRARLGLAEIRVANELDEFRRRKDATTNVRNEQPIIDI
jgi:P27 family predicted phage terminase small subunit